MAGALPTPPGLGHGLGLRWPRISTTRLSAAAGAGAALLGLAVVAPQICPQQERKQQHAPWHLVASLSLSQQAADEASLQVEKSSGVQFPVTLDDGKQLAGAGIRKKAILGLKNINVYAFGVYADPGSVKEKLGPKYGSLPAPNRDLYADVIASDVCLTVRLVIVYGRLKMGSVRSSFEESLGSRIQRFSGESNKPLLTKFTGLFRDDIKLPKGTTIDLTRLPGHLLQAKVNGEDIGRFKSQLLCRSLFDLYLGEEPFDKQAKEAVGNTLVRHLAT